MDNLRGMIESGGVSIEAASQQHAAPNEPGIPEGANFELWDKERDELINVFSTEDEALAARNGIIEATGADEDDFIVGRKEWVWDR